MGSVVQFGKVGKRTPKDVPAQLADQETHKDMRIFRLVWVAVLLIPWGLVALLIWEAFR